MGRFDNLSTAASEETRRQGRNAGITPRPCALHGSLVLCIALLMGACATTFERPAPVDDTALRERAQTVVEDGIRVSAAVPSVEENKAIFGVDLAAKRVQPVWIEIENNTERTLHFLPTGLDPEYFSPLEVAFAYHSGLSDEAKAQLDEHFQALGFESWIEPGSTVSGFIHTNWDRNTKIVNVDLFGRAWAKSFTLFVRIPETTSPETFQQRISKLYSESDFIQIEDEARLREALEELPCCTSSKEGGTRGEPLNLVVIGEFEAWAAAFIRRGYRHAVVSPQYAFGRPEDTAGQKQALWVAAQPHTVRLWLTTIRYQGNPVWIGQTSAPLGGRFQRQTITGNPAPIDPDVDEARLDLVQDLIYSQGLAKLGFVKGVGRVASTHPRETPSGATYHTDGLRAVMLFETRFISISELKFIEWERLTDHYRQQIQPAEAQ